MASILRSSKFVRYVAGFARNVVINTPREFDGNLVNTSQCLCGAIASPFSSQHSIQRDQSIDRSLKRIDQDVRKSGRISRRDIEEVLEEIRNSRSATTSQSLLVIRCCGNLVPDELPEIRTKLVKEIWNTLNRLNIPMDVSHYNALLRVYLENEHSFSPVEFLAEMKEKGIEPNRVTYQRLIARYCQDGDIEGATNVLEHMRLKELPVNENVFNALIIGHSEAGDMESAHGILSIMAQAGLEPSADTYTTLLCGYAKSGDIETMKKILEECESKEIHLLDKDYLDICYSLAISGHEEHLPIILSKVRKAIGYNQDALNIILNLVNKAKEEAGYLILKSMVRNFTPEGTPLPSGGFFIRQLVKVRRPVQNIIELCNRLETEGFLDRSLHTALEVSLETGNETIALSLMEELQKQGKEIRQHYFWPLFRSRAKDEGNDGVLRILKSMKKLGINPSSETIKDYAIPSIKGSLSEILAVLTNAEISVGSSALYLALSFLRQNKIQEAVILMGKVNAYYNPDILKRSLTQAFYKTKDLDSYITIVREIYESLDKKFNVLKEEDLSHLNKAEVIGDMISDLAFNKKNFEENIENVLNELVKQGISISTKSAEFIQEKLSDKMNDRISSLLGTLSSGELIPVPLARKPPVYTPSHQMNIPQLEKLIENCGQKKMDVRGLKRQLLSLYYRVKDLEKSEALIEELKNTPDFFFTGGIYAQLMDLYAYHENLEKTLYYFEKVKESKEENLSLSETKILRLAYLVYKNGQFAESLKVLTDTPRDRSVVEEERTFNYISIAWRFMNSLADEGRVDDLNELFNVLVSEEFVSVSNVILGPLVKVHLVNGDLDKALAKFEECVNMYKATPWKNELSCKLIQAEDAEKLQKLTDLSTTVHGEINSLYDLVFSFVECGRVRQARKILETPGLQTRPRKLTYACERYRQEGLVKPLEDLRDATKDLNHIDRSEIYYQLLLSYIKEKDTNKALNLWTQMQEEDLPPTDQFLSTLGNYLQTNGLEVPFIIPEIQQKEKSKQASMPKSPVSIFRTLVKNGNYQEAFEYRKNVENKLNIIDLSELIEKLAQNDMVDEAAILTLEMLGKKTPPVTRIFKFIVNKLALAGKVDAISSIGDKLNMESKKVISLDNRLCHAHIVAGRAEEYLSYLEKQIDLAKTEEDVKKLNDKFPRGGAYGILSNHPELQEKFEVVTKKYCEKGIVAPANILWTHYFIEEKYNKAEEIWEQHLKSAPRIMFQRIVQVARDKKNENLIEKLIEHLKTSNITEGALGNAYSCLLDVKVSLQQIDDIVQTFEKVLTDVSIDHLNRTAVLRVKSAYDHLGKPFPYKIPKKLNKNQTSSSSSSDNKDQKM
ncbi:hypothetical protein HHI36_011067 [Cryptolaemus montrouzieri]|uniref:PROP1-like PPR domain-containing protein n=1 Tax=Cryptolaemus montrouzieri TaxID=559131 RepID=A0ABD2MKL6_9CUCU